MKTIAILLASISLFLGGAALPFESGQTIDNCRLSKHSSKQRPQDNERPSLHSVGHLPMNFELNLGQADRQVMFLSRGKSLSLFLTPSEATLQWADLRVPTDQASSVGSFFVPKAGTFIAHQLLPFLPHWRVADEPEHSEKGGVKNHRAQCVGRNVLRMKLIGGEPHVRLTGAHELPGKVHYLRGINPGQQITNIPTFAQVRYENIYPGVDLVFYGNERKLEYDFVVSPGANPDTIRISFEGQEKLEIGDDGELVLYTGRGEIRQPKPLIYQEEKGRWQSISGHYALKSSHEVAFQIDTFNHAQPLIIDPELVYSTYLGGNGSEEDATGIAVDSQGNAYVAGTIASSDFPTTAGALQTTYGGGIYDAFVTKLNSSGALVYSTYLGTGGGERTPSIAIDSAGNAYVAGTTFSADFPTTSGSLQQAIGGANDVFVTKLNPTGGALVYSTFLGGSAIEEPSRIVVDAAGQVFVCGSTHSSNFPVTTGAFQRTKGAGDAEDGFVAKINSQGSTLIYSTFLGGSQPQAVFDLALDSAGNAYVTGLTYSPNFPTTSGAFQRSLSGSSDAFVAKLNPQGNALAYSTFLGGSGDEAGVGITTDSSGNAYVAGLTFSTDFPTVSPLQKTKGCNADAFVTKINLTGSALVYSTHIGGSGDEYLSRVALDNSGNLYIAGNTNSIDFPTTSDAFQATLGEGLCDGVPCSDTVVVKLNPTGTALLYSTYLGGSGDDASVGLALDVAGNAYVCGFTTSKDFPLKNPIQSALGNNSDPFVAKIAGGVGFSGNVSLFVPIVLSTSGLNGSFYSSELTLANRGSQGATVQLTYTSAFGGGGGTASIQLPAGQQKILSDAIEFLRSIGVPIPDSGNRGGTLSVRFSGISSSNDIAVIVRTTTQVSNGRAGLSYSAIPVSQGLSGPSYLCGLQQSATDRSNVAIQNVGASSDGDVVLRVTVFSGDPASPFSFTLPDETLRPGGFKQYTEILRSVPGPSGRPLTNGYVKVERLKGRAHYYAYAVVNDQANSDGSFVPPVREVTYAGAGPGRSLPVIVESGAFTSELILTNWTSHPSTLSLSFVADAIQASNSTADFVIELLPGEQRIIFNLVQYLREKGIAGIGPPGPTYVGPLLVTVDGGVGEGIFVGARTSAPGGGGRYGLFYVATPYCLATTQSAWLFGLQQNSENRANLALVNTGEAGDATDVFTIDLFDGLTGLKVGTVDGITLGAKHWTQIGTVLTQYASGVTQGYARVTRTQGTNPFIAYAIVNDGGEPGERSGDGAYVSSAP